MTATLYFIRHAAHGHLGQTLSGRMPGVSLSDDGRAQAAALARHLAGRRFAAIHTSPVQRAGETAAALAADRGLAPSVAPALDEIDFGTWTGRRFAELDGDPQWTRWNGERGSARVPGGETMAEAQARATGFAAAVAARHDGEAVALVSHCDVIRAVLAGYLGLPLDQALRFDIDPASVSRVSVGDWGHQIHSINEVMA
ncbi:histidine phosphatase family protein [Sphingomonas sp. GC_Shp_1]|uniref:histidine phosphatase family protein n=1 Tax=unclassified Sphingomonas TaxID=196159 RepID=UPI00226A86C1